MKLLIQLLVVQIVLVTVSSSHQKGNIVGLTSVLQAKLDRYRNDVNALQQQVNNLKTKLEASKGQQKLSISQLQQGMANQRDILSTIEGYMTLPFNVTRCECYDLTDYELKKVQTQIQSIKQKLNTLESDNSLNQTCKEYVQIHKQLARQKRYIQNIQKILTVKTICGQRQRKAISVLQPSGLSDISQSQLQTNLKAKGWCYGNLTPEKVKLLWFAFTVKNNIKNCPLQTPYFNGKQCINCEQPTPFFDLSQRKCIYAKKIDENRQCIGAIDQSQLNQKSDQDSSKKKKQPVYQDVQVKPVEVDPIIKTITVHKVKNIIQKVVEPIQGRAVLSKERKTINVGYEQVNPQIVDPEIKVIKVKKIQSSSNSQSESSSKSSVSKTVSSSNSQSRNSKESNNPSHNYLYDF